MAKRGGFRLGAGRKKGFAALEAERARAFIAEKLSKELDAIVEKAITLAKEGDKYAREWLTDRGYGKPGESLDITSKGDKVLEGVVVLPAKAKSTSKDKEKSDGSSK